MVNVKSYELSKRYACQERRLMSHLFEGKTNEQKAQKAQITKMCLWKVMSGEVTNTINDITSYVQTQFMEIGFDATLQVQELAKRTAIEINRFVNYVVKYDEEYVADGWQVANIKPGEKDILLQNEILVEGERPDFLKLYKDSTGNWKLRVVKVKTTKPKIKQKHINDADDTLEVYSLLCYGRAYLEENAPSNLLIEITAEIDYLRRDDDRYTSDPTKMKMSDFSDKGGGNIVQLVEEYRVGLGAKTGVDQRFEESISEFALGITKDSCKQQDCERCLMFDVCKFAAAPKILKKDPVIRSINDLRLTDAQKEAIDYRKGICRINAGAGSGKTTVISLRTAALLSEGVAPEEIMLFTFTDAAAKEMSARAKLMAEDFGLDEEIDMSKLGAMTFNAFGDMIIGEEHARFGFSKKPDVIDDEERSVIIAKMLKDRNITGLDYINFRSETRYCRGALSMTKKVFDIIKRGRYGTTETDVSAIYKELGADSAFISKDAVRSLAGLYEEYANTLKQENLIEFSDQEVLVQDILHENPFYMERFGIKHIIVDEFQDSSSWQIELIRKFVEAPSFESLMVVGDDSQSIYGFRNTSPEFIINFPSIIGGSVDDIYLLENHRSTPEIIEFANEINSLNQNRVVKDLLSTRDRGIPVSVKGFLAKEPEKEYVVQGILDHLAKGVKPEEMAIICATKYELAEMAGALAAVNVPTVLLNPEPMINNSRVRAAIAFCKAVRNIEDRQALITFANAKLPGGNGGILELDRNTVEDMISDLIVRINEINDVAYQNRKDLILEILREIDTDDEVYEAFLDKLDFKPLDRMYDYVDKFYEYGTKNEKRRTQDYPGVVLTTAHSSKGLEWKVVYAMISKFDSADLDGSKRGASALIEEKRRLLFVTATRARDELYVTAQYVAYGSVKNPSYNQFLKDCYNVKGMEWNTRAIEAKRAALQAEEKRKRLEKKLMKDALEKAAESAAIRSEKKVKEQELSKKSA